MIKLRQFLPSDFAGVLKVEEISFPKKSTYPESLFGRYCHKYPQRLTVAKEGKEIIGYTISQIRNHYGEIISLAVDPSWRKRGIGTKIINFLIDRLKDKDIKEIFLHVRTKNEVAISFYKNLGFKILKTIKNYYQNGDNAYLMKKLI